MCRFRCFFLFNKLAFDLNDGEHKLKSEVVEVILGLNVRNTEFSMRYNSLTKRQ
jgi:hypothetical protein